MYIYWDLRWLLQKYVRDTKLSYQTFQNLFIILLFPWLWMDLCITCFWYEHRLNVKFFETNEYITRVVYSYTIWWLERYLHDIISPHNVVWIRLLCDRGTSIPCPTCSVSHQLMAPQSITQDISWRHNCKASMWKVASISLNIGFMDEYIHCRSLAIFFSWKATISLVEAPASLLPIKPCMKTKNSRCFYCSQETICKLP